MKVSIVVTVLNEEETIGELLSSILQQSALPDEVIVVDGGSTDLTVSNIKYQISNIKYFKSRLRPFIKKSNRAIGRNYGISKAKNEIVALTDAGCILDKNWLKNITTPFESTEVDVVAGFYQGLPKSIFEKCLVPYALVMPDKVNPKTFLPASRSMALRRSIWQRAGGFPEEFSDNEDYVFAHKLKKMHAKTVFQKKAVVFWMPRKNLIEAFMMFFKFAKGDMEAQIVRPKVVLLFLRYIIGLTLVILSIERIWLPSYFLILVTVYLFWAIGKNYRYVADWRAIFILPLLQLTADTSVLTGSIYGIYKRGN